MSKLKTHLVERHFNLELYPNAVLSEEENSLTLYLWNLSGQLLGYQTYKPNRPKNDLSLPPRELRYFTHITKTPYKENMLACWGVELLNPLLPDVFLCEGVFDAVRLHNLGLNALALFSCCSLHLKEWLHSLGYNLVPVCDGDEAGLQLAELSNNGECLFLSDNKDLGDLTDEEVTLLLKDFL